MKSRKSRRDPHTNREVPRTSSDGSPAATGDAFATEEDIGTEGAGTEPRAGPQAERITGAPSRRPRRGKSPG